MACMISRLMVMYLLQIFGLEKNEYYILGKITTFCAAPIEFSLKIG